MIEKLTASDFKELTEQAFKLRHGECPDAEAKLIEVEKLSGQSGPSGRTPFSLLFACDESTEAVQSVFDLEHEKLGSLEVFLVPVGKDERGLLLEAVFS